MQSYDVAMDALQLDRRKPVPYERLEKELCPKHGLTLQNCRSLVRGFWRRRAHPPLICAQGYRYRNQHSSGGFGFHQRGTTRAQA